VKVTLYGTRGSLAAAGPDTVDYGGDTSAALVHANRDTIVLDAGTGIRRLGADIAPGAKRVDVLLTHLHMDHIQGLGFFGPIYLPGIDVHIWAPASDEVDLGERLTRYLSPPLFPVRLRELSGVILHPVEPGSFFVGDLQVTADVVVHPGTTVGYRLDDGASSVVYLPDHEPALGDPNFPSGPEWTSGHDLAFGTDVLIHDAQYFDDEYDAREGWGHSTYDHALAFAGQAKVRRLVTFHHDPSHDDEALERKAREIGAMDLDFDFTPGKAGTVLHT
jgi:phosphoribosyl 1,2-cyclic phosphodiesterase